LHKIICLNRLKDVGKNHLSLLGDRDIFLLFNGLCYILSVSKIEIKTRTLIVPQRRKDYNYLYQDLKNLVQAVCLGNAK